MSAALPVEGGSAEVAAIVARIARYDPGYRIDAEIRLTNCNFDGKVLSLGYEGMPVAFQDIGCSVGTVRNTAPLSGLPRIAIEVAQWRKPSSLTVTGFMHWDPAATDALPWLPCFVLPDFLPAPAVERACPQPAIIVEGHTNGDLLAFEPADLRRTQVGLFVPGALHVRRHDSVVLASDTALSKHDSGVALTNLRDTTSILAELFGVVPHLTTVYACLRTPSMVRDPGGVVNATAVELLVPPPGREALARRFRTLLIARTWWGIGVRVPGNDGTILTHAISMWATAQAEQTAGAPSWLQALVTDTRTDVHRAQAAAARKAIDLLSLPRAQVRDVLGQLTARYWGWTVSLPMLVADLQRGLGRDSKFFQDTSVGR